MTNYIYRMKEVRATIVERVPLAPQFTLEEAYEVAEKLRFDTDLAFSFLTDGSKPVFHTAFDIYEQDDFASYLILSDNDNYQITDKNVIDIPPAWVASFHGLITDSEFQELQEEKEKRREEENSAD